MITCKYNSNNSITTKMEYISSDRSTIIITKSPDIPMVFDFELFEFEIKDIIGLTKIKFLLSFKHLIDFILSALDCLDYADSKIMNIPYQTTYESISLIFDYVDESNIHFLIYKRNPYTSILMSDILFTQDSLIDFINIILNDYLEKNHKIEVINQLKNAGIIWG